MIDEKAFQAFMLAVHEHGPSGLGYRKALEAYEAAMQERGGDTSEILDNKRLRAECKKRACLQGHYNCNCDHAAGGASAFDYLASNGYLATREPVAVDLRAGAEAISVSLSDAHTRIYSRNFHLPEAKACAQAWGLKYVD